MNFRELLESLRRTGSGLAGWANEFTVFTLVVLFALSGHLLLALLLNTLAAFGVDFSALDRSHHGVPIAQVLLFALQAALMVYVIAKAGLPMNKTLVGIAAMFWATAMLMITFVSAQCDLYGACL